MRHLLLLAALGLIGCDSDDASSRPSPLPAPEVEPSASTSQMSSCRGSENPIDVAVCPAMTARGCADAPRASTPDLCRRLHLDLTGVAPTSAEVAERCEGKSAAAIARALMATPEYVQHALELWATVLAYEPAYIDAKWLAAADAMVAEMVTGRVAYDEFAKRIVGQPIFGVGARLPRADIDEIDHPIFFEQVADRAMRVFLGRAPIGTEAARFSKLFEFWRKNVVLTSAASGYAEAVLDPSVCPCEATVLGATTRIELPLGAATPYESVPSTVRASLDAELRKPGALLAAQRPFYTQAVDLALSMVLGWWKSTMNLDESTLVEAQVALAETFRAKPTWPELVLAIVTSTLYERSNRSAEDAPVWCAGPTRNVRPEAYVASLGHLLSVRVGRCDHRTYEARGSAAVFFRPELREDEDSDASLFGTIDYHRIASTRMGGCIAGGPRTEDASLAPIFGAPSVAHDVCAASSAIVPPEPNPSNDRIVDHVSGLLRGKIASPAERAAFAVDASACRADASCDARTLATTACVGLARSFDAITY